MKRLLTMAAMFLCCMVTTFAQYSGSGSGTEEDPYLIYNQDQLSQVSNFLNQDGVVFKLMKDLDMTSWIAENNPSQGWLPIGVESAPFKGVFYGNNHNISGLTINRKSTNHVGFFGYVTNATVSNLTLKWTSVTGASNVGAFVGYILGSTVSNCHVEMKGGNGVTGTTNVGGFAGYSTNTNYQTFSVAAMVNSSENNGGFAGKVETGTFSDGSFSGELTGKGSFTGGLIGNASGLTLTNIVVKGTVTGKDYTGGIVGCNLTGSFSNCKYEGELTGNQYVGGIVGALESTMSTFTSCFSKGKIIATGDYAGGIVGISKGACIEEMESCSHFGDIEGKNYMGGIVGAILCADIAPYLYTYEIRHSSEGTLLKTYKESITNGSSLTVPVNNCTAIGNIYGTNWVGGLIGSDLSSYGYTPDVITGNNEFYRSEYSPSLKRTFYYYHRVYKDGTYLTNNSTFTYTNYIRNATSIMLTNNYYSGSIYGVDYVGGLVGCKSGGAILYNYSYANLFGASNVGGIAGNISAENIDYSDFKTTLKSNASINNIISATSSNIGRIYGSAEMEYVNLGALGSAESNRALVQTKVVLQGIVQEVEDDLQNGTSIGPSWLKLKANYVSMGWDFDNNWNNLEYECYPYKKYQAAPPIIKSNLVSQATSISGQSLNGGTVYLYYKDRDAVSTKCDGFNWTFTTEPLQSGALVQIYADMEGMTPSYYTTTTVGYPGSGTEADPYRIYTADDLQGASNLGYYKLMNDIDLASWINENSPTEGWPAIGRNSGEATYIDGDGHKVTGLWMNTTQNYNGLFSNFSAGQIKNLTVEVAEGKKVKGGDFTGILIGRNANGSLVNCTVKGDVEGTGHVGGLVGYSENTTISTITANATVTGKGNVGGIAGQTLNCDMTNNNATTTIASSGANSKVGGLVGYSKEGSISKCSAQNNLAAEDGTNYVGGLVGYSETPVSLSFSAGSVAATGNDSYSGGLVGYALSPIENSYSTANTTGTLFTAGLVGYTFSSINKCYAKGDVNGVTYGGGVVGELDGSAASISNSVACCNTLSLTAQTSWGSRVIGGFKNGAAEPGNTNFALKTMQVSLNNVPQTKTDDAVEGIAKTGAELKASATYQGIGWDMTGVWTIVEGESYPTLKENENSGGNQEDPDDFEEGVNTLYGIDIQTLAGSNVVLHINLNNQDEVKLSQFDLQLPTGVTVAKKSNGKLDAKLTERAETHSISSQQLSNGNYRFIISSMDNDSFTGNSGTLVEITLDIPATMEAGEYTVKLLNAELSVPDGNDLKVVKPADTESKLTIKTYTPGDVNNDGSVSVTDVGCVINYILEQVPSVFIFDAADMNGDKSISVTDVGIIINLILNEGAAARSKFSRGESGNVYLSQQLTTDGHLLQLENKNTFIGFQMDLQLANGAIINSMKLMGGDDHLMTYRKLTNGSWRVVCYSPTNSAFIGDDSALLNIATNSDVNISNVRFTTIGLSEVCIDAIRAGTTGVIDVNELVNQNEEVKVYTLDGRHCRTIRAQSGENPLKGLKAGIYIIGSRKVVVR